MRIIISRPDKAKCYILYAMLCQAHRIMGNIHSLRYFSSRISIWSASPQLKMPDSGFVRISRCGPVFCRSPSPFVHYRFLSLTSVDFSLWRRAAMPPGCLRCYRPRTPKRGLPRGIPRNTTTAFAMPRRRLYIVISTERRI